MAAGPTQPKADSHLAQAVGRDECDSPWKQLLMRFFEPFMAFYFPAAHKAIDWTRGYEFLDKELRQVTRDAALGRRDADLLVRLWLRESDVPQIVHAHVEVQGQPEKQFEQRIYVYAYRIYDRFAVPVASFVLLIDEQAHWRPERFAFEALGSRMEYAWNVAKLLDWQAHQAELAQDDNPFALVTLAHLATLRTRRAPSQRWQAKRRLVKLLYERGYQRQEVLDLFAAIDWLMRLPEELEQALWQEIGELEQEKKMRYITSVERLAIRRGWEKGLAEGMQQGMRQGMQQGIQQGVQQGEKQALVFLLQRKFGALPDPVQHRIAQASQEEIETWLARLLQAERLDDVFTRH